ncbi:unnamed protein product, partial [Polarella glacialis]
LHLLDSGEIAPSAQPPVGVSNIPCSPTRHINNSNNSSPTRAFTELRLAESSTLFLRSSLILIPNLLSKEECQLLIDAAERRVSQGSEGRIVHAYQYAPDALQSIWESFRTRVWSGRGDTSASAGVEPLERLPVCYLNSEARKLSDTILRDRLLPFLERELPDFCRGATQHVVE